MKVFPLLLLFLLSAAGFSQETSLDSKFKSNPSIRTEHVSSGHTLFILDDDITMDKLYTSIRYELVYSGSDKSRVYFKHNEYLSDGNGFFTKTGYSSDMEYDITKSNIIDYKGLKLEIVSANPQELNFRILSGTEASIVATSN